MPRSAAKSQADKCGRRSSVQVTTPQMQDLEVEYIIPGQLTQNQWMDMLMHEEAEETVGEIMDELMCKVMEGCFKVYIERQMAPYSALWAITHLTEIVTQQFLCHDEGEKSEEASKTEDSEPLPAIPDSWAQGCVPIVYPMPPSYLISKQEDNINELPKETETRVQTREQHHLMAQTNISPKLSVKETSPIKPTDDRSYKRFVLHPPPNINQKKKQQKHSLSKTVLGKLLPSLSHSSEKKVMKTEAEEHSVVHDHLPRLVNQHKEHQSIPKLEYSQLPRHFITPQYEIVDNNYTKNISKKPNRDSKVEQRCKKQESEWAVVPQKPQTSYVNQPAKRRDEVDVLVKRVSLPRPKGEGIVTPGPLGTK
ncbi:uncharacterized protein C2orf81 homolog [Sphaeramia orbicularis]|uniref:uncharacterized protein C2orf81 homolog n=1 Tax=Sphaeramia orbicularis TaxID=375764 RepID=UPI00117F86BF|nr:uncharacterized protein C2orf81 homolog [Sphaeramia orbicularis]